MAPLYACAKILISTRGLLEAYHNSKRGLLEAYHNSESGLLEAYHNRKRGLLEAPYISKSGLLEAPLDACAKILTLFVLSPTIASARAPAIATENHYLLLRELSNYTSLRLENHAIDSARALHP